MSQDRLQKIIANAGLMSRRAAEEAITEGRVSVNGVTVTELGTRADPLNDVIEVDGKRIEVTSHKRTFLFYKPVGVVTTKSDPEGRPTVMDYFKDVPSVNPVGRLDVDSEGLLVMTEDGDLLLKLTHPRFERTKVYEVWIEGGLKPNFAKQLVAGVELSDGIGKFDACDVLKRIGTGKGFTVTVSEGRNRFIRRMFGALGITVTRLKRIRMGGYELGDLKPGERKEV